MKYFTTGLLSQNTCCWYLTCVWWDVFTWVKVCMYHFNILQTVHAGKLRVIRLTHDQSFMLGPFWLWSTVEFITESFPPSPTIFTHRGLIYLPDCWKKRERDYAVKVREKNKENGTRGQNLTCTLIVFVILHADEGKLVFTRLRAETQRVLQNSTVLVWHQGSDWDA